VVTPVFSSNKAHQVVDLNFALPHAFFAVVEASIPKPPPPAELAAGHGSELLLRRLKLGRARAGARCDCEDRLIAIDAC
jgi:hypothetical protein